MGKNHLRPTSAKEKAIAEGKRRLTFEEAHARQPVVTIPWLKNHANRRTPLFHHNVLTAPWILRKCDNGQERWYRGVLPDDVDTVAGQMKAAAALATHIGASTSLTISQAFEKYDHWVKKVRDPKRRRRAFEIMLRGWIIRGCHWLKGAKPRTGRAVLMVPTKGRAAPYVTKPRVTFGAAELALIDRRMRAQAEGVWWRTDGGEWFSAEQVRNKEHGNKHVTEFVTIAVGAERHKTSTTRVRNWTKVCVYRGSPIDHHECETFTPAGGRHQKKWHETVVNAQQLADAVRVAKGERYDKSRCNGDELAPRSVLMRELGIHSRKAFDLRAKAIGLKPMTSTQAVRVGEALAQPMDLFRRDDALLMRGRTLAELRSHPPTLPAASRRLTPTQTAARRSRNRLRSTRASHRPIKFPPAECDRFYTRWKASEWASSLPAYCTAMREDYAKARAMMAARRARKSREKDAHEVGQ
jgi:hypothetical protein